MGKRGKKGKEEISILSQVKRFLKMEREIGEDNRGKEGNLHNPRKKMGGLVSAVLAAFLAAGCALFPSRAIEDNYQSIGTHSGIVVNQTYSRGEFVGPKTETKWTYKISKRNGKTWFEGDIYNGEIDPGERTKREIERLGEREVIKFKDGTEHVVVPITKVLGKTPDGSYIFVFDIKPYGKHPYPQVVSKETYDDARKDSGEFMKSIWQGLTERGRKARGVK